MFKVVTKCVHLYEIFSTNVKRKAYALSQSMVYETSKGKIPLNNKHPFKQMCGL